jgi:hypothetical protein
VITTAHDLPTAATTRFHVEITHWWQFGAPGDPQLAIYSGEVLFDGTDRNVEALSDLAIRVVLCGKGGHTYLSVAEPRYLIIISCSGAELLILTAPTRGQSSEQRFRMTLTSDAARPGHHHTCSTKFAELVAGAAEIGQRMGEFEPIPTLL